MDVKDKPPAYQKPTPVVKPTREQIIGGLVKRIQHAIYLISDKSLPQYRGMLDSYYRHVSPAMADKSDSMLPIALRRGSGPGRTTMADRWHVLYFHIGDAILGFYDVCLGEKTPADLEPLVVLLEYVAASLKDFVVEGDERIGYRLSHPASDQAIGALRDKDQAH